MVNMSRFLQSKEISLPEIRLGISDYIRSERIKRAKRLLLNSSDTVASVAAAVGIGDANYFIRTFKTVVGVTPLQYRKGKRG